MGVDAFRPLGGHQARIEGDTIHLKVEGVVTLSDMVDFMHAQAQVRREHGFVFMLYDSRKNTGLEPAARKYATDHTTPESRIDAAASFGAPFAIRVLVNMLNRAHDMLGREGARTLLFETEAQAREYLDAERRRLRPSAAA